MAATKALPDSGRFTIPPHYVSASAVTCKWINGELYALNPATHVWENAPEGSERIKALTAAWKQAQDDEAARLAIKSKVDEAEQERTRKRNSPAAIARRRKSKADRSLKVGLNRLELYLQYSRNTVITKLLEQSIEIAHAALQEHNRAEYERTSALYQASVDLWVVERIMLERGITSLDDILPDTEPNPTVSVSC